MNKRVLIIEDDSDIVDLIELHLKDLDYSLDHAMDGREGLEKARTGNYLLIILDLMLPELDGLEVCKRLRSDRNNVPILMLTSKSEELDKVLGLELGADDYLTKPFSIHELLARIKALIRRAYEEPAQVPDQEQLVFGTLLVDIKKRKVSLNGERIELTAKEFDLLRLFASNPGRTYSREQLLNQVWGYQFTGYDHTVNAHINRLRVKIDQSNQKFIQTVWGVGYRFIEQEELENGQITE